MIELPSREEMESIETYEEWSSGQDRCAACYKKHDEAFWDIVGLSTHHLVKRSRRLCHLPWNLLRLCMRCHELAELTRIGGLSPITFAIALTIKQEGLAEEWRPDMLEELYGARLPDLEPLPFWLIRERERREPIPSWRLLSKGDGRP
jgi:hypothetical protein